MLVDLSENQNNVAQYITFIGEYYNDSKERYSACHYALLVYYFLSNKYFYCDLDGTNQYI